MYAPDWGCSQWTDDDRDWETADECTRYRQDRLFDSEFHHHYRYLPWNEIEHAIIDNDAAEPIWNSLRFTCRPEDLRLVNCARKIKKAFRRASNDPSYKMCRKRILLLDNEEGFYAR